MFGYVRPHQKSLTKEQQERYQAAYCGLCRTIGARYSLISQMFLNYDFAFLAMVLAKSESPCISCKRCVVNPFRKREIWHGDDGLNLAADESVVLTYWKLRDHVQDSGFLKGIPSRFLSLLLTPDYRKAKKRCPAFDDTANACLEELRRLEEENCTYPDRPADTFARILQSASGADGQAGSAALSQMLYHIGRWIYLIDAWDDLEKDRKEGNYNPYLAQSGEAAESQKESLRETMYASLGLAQGAARWLSLGEWTPIIDNILHLGLPSIEEAVLDGTWQKKKQNPISEENSP